MSCGDETSVPGISCSDLFGNTGGDWTGCIAEQMGRDGNFSEDPRFCDAAGGNYHLDSQSPCAPAQQPACGLIGAYEVGCGATATQPVTWGAVKGLFR